jgi:hypothetical protein
MNDAERWFRRPLQQVSDGDIFRWLAVREVLIDFDREANQ